MQDYDVTWWSFLIGNWHEQDQINRKKSYRVLFSNM